MKKRLSRLAFTVALLLTVAAEAGAQEQAQAQEEGSFNVTGRYTAQRRPRIAVLDFQDTNASAQDARYGSSVQAMLVTFLKRKSQLVVVERQNLGNVLDEWQRNRQGMTNLLPEDPTAQQLLEKIDGIIIGNVTLLNVETEANVVQKPDSGDGTGRRRVSGPRIEIDAKLLSRADGRIIAAAQRRGPVVCLRSIIERLGIALEQEFLRPYYGKLKLSLTSTENVRVYLTPILLDTALDEEKPPVERSSTVIMGSDRDIVEPWTTDPTTYTIENLLSGWYVMRLERPGYEGIGTSIAQWQARDIFGRVQVYDSLKGQTLTSHDPEGRFVVRVDPLRTEVIDGDERGFELRKKGGSLGVRVRRQYLDTDYTHAPRRVILIGDEGLEINRPQEIKEYADDEECDLFDEREPSAADYGRTYMTAGEKFDLEMFKGGKLIIEDYKGEVLPVGEYQVALWEPKYETHLGSVTVRDRDQDKLTRTALVRTTRGLNLATTGVKPAYKVILEASETGHKIELPLDFERSKVQSGLPVDSYTARTSIPVFSNWRRSFDLSPSDLTPPIYDPELDQELAKRKAEAGRGQQGQGKQGQSSSAGRQMPIKSSWEDTGSSPPVLNVKTRLSLAGRLPVLARLPEETADDLYIDRRLQRLLNQVLYGQQVRPEKEEDRNALEAAGRIAAKVGRMATPMASVELTARGQIGTPPPDAQAGSSTVPAHPAGGSPDGSTPETALPQTAPGQPMVSRSPEGAAQAGEPMQESPDESLPRDPEELRDLLARRLEDIDLLILDGRDMARIRENRGAATVIAKYVEQGGSLFAFVSEGGDYGESLGAPLAILDKEKETDRFELAMGEVSGISLQVGKNIDVKSKRMLPVIEKLPPNGQWRVIAFTKGRKDPRILERGQRDKGGSVIIWLDNPDSFRGRKGGTVPEVEVVRGKVESYVLRSARSLMERRFGGASQQAEKAAVR